MRPLIIIIIFFFLLQSFSSFAQTEGWTSFCATEAPTVSEVMIDGCSDEFKSEYVVLKTSNKPFDIRNLVMKVVNPFNNAFIGSVSVQDNNHNTDALNRLNEAAIRTCNYGTVFRDAFNPPYNGIIPANTTILFFNNKDSTDVSYLSPGELSRLCGSKVLVVFGTLNPQSRGVSIFRNYPQNGSCGTSGCLRQIQFQFNGINQAFCTQLTYDIKKLPNLNTSNPPVGFNEGSYIRLNPNGDLIYGGGNLTGAGIVCMPPTKMLCHIPVMPDYGNNLWNVLAFDGFNDWSNSSFKGYYQAKGNQTMSFGTATTDNFEFNTAKQGWSGVQSPSEAHTTLGALTTYNGCNVRMDSFSILAKRKGFVCGFYDINLHYYDDFTRIRIDNDGDGIWDFDQSYHAPACSSDCGNNIWQGFLSPRSKMEVYSYDLTGNFNVYILFQRKTTPPSVKINILSTTPVACNGSSSGSIATSVTGGLTPYNIVWSGVVPIPDGRLTATNLPSGLFQMRVTDAVGCLDSAQILVPQLNNIRVNASGDTAFCPNGTAILRGMANGGTGNLYAEWLTTTSPMVLSRTFDYAPIVSKSTSYVIRVSDDGGCSETDTVVVDVHIPPVVQVTISPNDTICNDAIPLLKARGAESYTWSSFPQIGATALSAQGDSARLFALYLPAPYYIFTATGTDIHGCQNTGELVVTLVPLPIVTILPVLDTLCSQGAPQALTFSPITEGRFSVFLITPTATIPCLDCIENGIFYPKRSGAGEFLVRYEVMTAGGCRNAPSIHINVKNCICPSSLIVSFTKTICKGDSFRVKDNFYKTVGIYRDTFHKNNGCDSIVIINLIVVKSDTTYRIATSCDPNRIGIDSLHLTNQLGCDSLVITRTTLSSKDTTYLFSKTCNPLDTGTRQINLRNHLGCDSIVLMQTSLKRRDSTRLQWFICDNDSLVFGSRWLTKRGTYFETLTNQEGCDSVLILTLDFWKKDTTFIQKTTCNPLKIGTSTEILRGGRGCDSIVITHVNLINSDIKTSIIVLNPISCNNVDDGALSVKVFSGGHAPFRFDWHNGSKDSLLKRLGAGLYMVTITDAEGCKITDSLRLNNPFPLNIAAFGLKSPCYDENMGSIRINAFGGGQAPYRFVWSGGTQNLTTPPIVINNIKQGNYSFKLIDAAGCTLDSTFTVPAASKHTVDVSKDITIELGDSTLIKASLNFSPAQIVWTAIEGFIRCDTCLSTFVKPSQSTVYKLIATDTFGCELSNNIRVFVQKSRDVFIPTSFSPNDDGINDHFTVFADQKVRKVQTMKVFNRWGSVLFEQNDFQPNDENKGWNGKINGTAAPSDVYVFFMKIEFIDGKVFTYQGDVTIVK